MLPLGRSKKTISVWGVVHGVARRDGPYRRACWLASGLLLAALLSACTAPARPTPAAAVTQTGSELPGAPPSQAPTHTMPAATVVTGAETALPADVTLTQAQQQQPTTVKVGQVIHISGIPEFEWHVSYRAQVLLALTPPEKMNNPGASGWYFRVAAPGNTEIVLQSGAPTCPAGATCPPNVQRFVFPIQAVP